MLELNEIKKDLYKSKEMAKFSHYNKGRLFYEVKILDGKYQFPIHTVETKKTKHVLSFEGKNHEIVKVNECDLKVGGFEMEQIVLSEDLGETTFSNEIKGSELIRWIDKAIKNEEIKKVS